MSSAALKTNLPYYHVLEKWQIFVIAVNYNEFVMTFITCV